jgi:hypothetical protein
MRWPVLLCAVAVAGGCGADEREPRAKRDVPPQRDAREAPATREAPPQRLAQTRETTRARCNVGARPRYFVPKTPDSPLALLGCVRLGVSGKRVELSATVARIGREHHSCIHPAYFGRSHFIPAICALEPPLARFAVRDAAQPRQGVRGYGYVIWGTAGDSEAVVARFHGGTARAAILNVPRRLARRFGEPPFRLFVTELPQAAVCAPVTVASGKAVEWIRPARRGCSIPTACRMSRPGFRPPGHVPNRPGRRPCLP